MAQGLPQYHTHLVGGDVGRYVLLVGDPGQCNSVAGYLEGAVKVAANREYTTYTGALHGVPVSVVSTGIGSPSMAIAVEELAEIGADTLIRVGTAGGLQNFLSAGDVVIVQAAVRAEGTSSAYVPAAYPAVAHSMVVRALEDGAGARGLLAHTGIVTSGDALYADLAPHTMPLAAIQTGNLNTVWTRAGVLATEMECSTLFVVSAVRGLRAGGVLTVVNSTSAGARETQEAQLSLDPTIRVAIMGIEELIKWDAMPRGS